VAALARNQIRSLGGEEAESRDEVRFLRECVARSDAGDVCRVPGVERQDCYCVGVKSGRTARLHARILARQLSFVRCEGLSRDAGRRSLDAPRWTQLANAGHRQRLAQLKGPEVRAPVRGPPLRIVAPTAEFLSAPSLRAFDLRQEAEPYLKEIGAGFVCCHHGFADLIRPNPTPAR